VISPADRTLLVTLSYGRIAPMGRVMGVIRLSRRNRASAIQFAILGNVVPVAIATASNFPSHHRLFFAGAIGACAAPIIVTASSRHHRFAFYPAAFGGLAALTLMQAYSGGAASGYSVLLMMAMIWFGLEATDRELLAGMVCLAACCYLPMLVAGPPAYPVHWGHATLLFLIGFAVAVSLRTLTREMQALTRRLREDAVMDDLTGLLNRRGWRYAAPRELERSSRHGAPLTLVMLDIDDFKGLNDHLGHEEGDRVLRKTGERLRATLRAGDTVARLGGDEFVALLTSSTEAGAQEAVARLRSATPPQGTFSAGIAEWNREEGLDELLRRADLALYAAKARGGDRTELAPALPSSPETVEMPAGTGAVLS
jgi:diguanylate cyclase (GGDEF)-like protein